MTAIRLQTGLEIQAAGLVPLKKGEKILVYVRPEEFIFTEPGQGMKGTVTVKRFLGKYIDYHVDLGTGAPVEVTADTSSAQRIYAVGEEVSLTVNVRRINFFSKDSQLTLVEGVESHV